MIRVLIVDDSPTVRLLLTEILNSDPALQVVGTAADGEEAVQQTLALKPDLITMDIRMPHMDGFEATRRIMELRPTPIVVVSASVEASDLQITFNAIQAGALEVIEKPAGFSHLNFETIRERLVTTVKLMAEVKVVRRRTSRPTASLMSPVVVPQSRPTLSLVAIGASTGGPTALHTLLTNLPHDFPWPIVVVQHMSAGFLAGLVSWLQSECSLPLQVATEGEHIVPGQAYFAPDDHHLVFLSRGILVLNQSPRVSHVRPSATVLFDSVARIYGAEAVGVLLTGMGDDGAVGLRTIHDRGGLTLAQDESTSVVYGMPKVAAELGAVDHILPIGKIAPTLLHLVQGQKTG